MPLCRNGRVILPAAWSAFHGFIHGRTPCSRSAMIRLVILLYTSRVSFMSPSPELEWKQPCCFPGPRERWRWKGKTGFSGTENATKLNPLSWGNFVCRFGWKPVWGREEATPLGPRYAASAAEKFLARDRHRKGGDAQAARLPREGGGVELDPRGRAPDDGKIMKRTSIERFANRWGCPS